MPGTPDVVSAITSDTTLTIVTIVLLGIVVLLLGGLLWWFIRDRMKSIDKRIDTKEVDQDRRIEDMQVQFTRWFDTQDKREEERRVSQDTLDRERHQAVINHYNTLETRLKGGSEIFTELRNGLTKSNERFTGALTDLEKQIQTSNVEFRKAAEDIRSAFLQAQINFVSKSEFDRFQNQREEERRRRDSEFAKLQQSQNDLISEVRSLRGAFEATRETFNAAVGRLMDQKLEEAACRNADEQARRESA